MNGPSPPHSTLQTPGFAHYGIAWSPFHTHRLALASSANYGLVGNGRLHIISVSPSQPSSVAPYGQGAAQAQLSLESWYATQDALYDLAWSEVHENQIVTASGDGSLRLWDITLNDLPIRMWKEHTREVYSVDWSNLQKDRFVSSSWDGTVKIWSAEHPHSLTTLQAASASTCIYQALFSPHHPSLLASCSADGTIKLFDIRSPTLLTAPTSFTNPLSTPALTIPPSFAPAAQGGGGGGGGGGRDILSIDWNKYRHMVLASAGVDRSVRVWDCRMLRVGGGGDVGQEIGPMVGGKCETEIVGHEYAVRKVQWCPHRPDVLASASYDMTCRVWSTMPSSSPMQPLSGSNHLRHIHDAHTEFVVGCAWSLYDEGILASCAWDCRVDVFRAPV